jgi:hypothetical protein
MKHILELIIFAGLLNLIVILLNLSKKSNFTVDLDYNKNEFNVNNLCCYFSSVKGEVSMKRKIHLINELNKYNIKYQVDSGVTNLDTNNARMYQHILNKLLAFKKSNYDYAIICDDDFAPCPNFKNELLKTIKYAKNNFRCIHLCPGYLWGRLYRDSTKIGKLNPEGDISNLKHNGRLFYNIDKNEWISKKIWLGGPLCFLINKKHINNFIEDYKSNYKKTGEPNDVVLLNIINDDDYVCREPQLGYELEQGESTRI